MKYTHFHVTNSWLNYKVYVIKGNFFDCDLLLYADDSALLIRGKNIIDIEQKLCEELTKLNVWLIDNKLSLHLGKTESILFASNRKLKQHKFLRISCNGIKVGGKEVVTYLGVN